MKRIRNLYWKIFFSAYWVAKDLNKKNDPPWSACGIMEIISINIFSGLFFMACFVYGGKIPYYEVIILGYIFLLVMINEIIKPKHKKMIKYYDYLSKPESKKLRFNIAFGALLTGLLIMIIGAFSMNETVQSFFRDLFM
ncbi:MAG: hypothetical protein PHV20_02265 [Bacteroidales bacterium]|nr:hypothetical protein [Bacteroidales bacterium]